jgi:methionyl-tRNA synthetase
MSKSLGNVLDPFELLETYGIDYVRYFMCSEIHFGNDGDFSHDSFCLKINSDLANDFGNLVQRAMVMIHKNCDGEIPISDLLTIEDEKLLNTAREVRDMIVEQLDQQNIKSVCEAAINLAKLGNRYIDTEAPWKLLKNGNIERTRTVLYVLVELLRLIAIYLEPVMPTSCGKLFDQMGIPEDYRSFESISKSLPNGLQTTNPQPIFPKIEPDHKKIDASAVAALPKATKAGASYAELTTKLEEKYANLTTSTEIEALIAQMGNQIRVLKAEKAEKDVIQPLAWELNYLKHR